MQTAREIPIFPLGTTLLPGMPAMLRVFEERYLVMLTDVLASDVPEFGIVLIERGAEVGGGDRRFTVGTIATVTQLLEGDGFVGLVAQGGDRFEVDSWEEDDPYPRALVRDLPDLVWEEELTERFESTERAVRRVMARSSEFIEPQWSADTELADDPVTAAWQLAGIAPMEEMDRFALLQAESLDDLLQQTARLSEESIETLALRSGGDDFGGEWDDPRDTPS